MVRTMKKQLLAIGLLAFTMLSNHLFAQEFSLGGEYRINPVYSDGFRLPMYEGDKVGFYTTQRTRLIFNYTQKDDMDVEFVIQDKRTWGDQDDRADVANIAVFRAWVEKYFTPAFSLKLGRQGLVYNDQFILSDPNWVGTRAHDAALLKYENNGFKAHLMGALNANGRDVKREPYEFGRMYKTMQFLYVEKEFENLKASFIAINKGVEKTDTTTDMSYKQTFGPWVKFNVNDRLSLKGIYYHQIGNTEDGRDINANFYSAQVEYKATDFLSFKLAVDAASGTDQSVLNDENSTTYNSFDRHYGLHHGHFGLVDYFYVKNPTLTGVKDYYLKTVAKITKKLTIDNRLHYFQTDGNINSMEDGTIMDPDLGVENDFVVKYKASDTFKFSVTHAIMFGTPTLDTFFGGQESVGNQAVFAVITFSPQFLKTKLN
jgi:hypothetical protein